MDIVARSVSELIDLVALSDNHGTHEKDFKHMHFSNELVYFFNGSVKYMIDGQTYIVQPHDIVLIPKGTYHNMINESTAPHALHVINFYDELLPENLLTRLLTPPFVFNIRNDPHIPHIFDLLKYVFTNYNKEDIPYSANSVVKELLTYCSYISRVSFSVAGQNPLVEKIVEYVSSHIEEKLDADIISANLNMSPSHIQNTFSEHMKIGLKQYITEKKIMAAQSDLLAGMPAVNVSMKYHFNDYSTFWRLYKKSFGVPPSSCKKRYEAK